MSKHESGKALRRAKILAAARAALAETGEMGFSMRALAERADVSFATPYNLFGSKGEIVVQLYNEDLAAFEERVARLKSKDALDRLFDIVALCRAIYAADVTFYRTIFGATANLQEAGLCERVAAPRLAFWQHAVDALAGEGLLRSGADTRLAATTMTHVIRSALSRWTFDEISLKRLEVEMAAGFALILMSVSTPSAQERLQARLAKLQGEFARLRK